MTRLLAVERLAELAPSLVIVQAGHNDDGVTAQVERRQVLRTIDLIRMEAPRARIALLTVFSSPSGPVPPALFRTDQAIVTAAREVDPRVIIMDPLTGHWKFQHADEGLHPTAAGDAWIARKVATILRDHGIAASPSTVTGAVICELSAPAKPVLAQLPLVRQRCLRARPGCRDGAADDQEQRVSAGLPSRAVCGRPAAVGRQQGQPPRYSLV